MENVKLWIATIIAVMQVAMKDNSLLLALIISATWLATVALIGKTALILAVPGLIIALVKMAF